METPALIPRPERTLTTVSSLVDHLKNGVDWIGDINTYPIECKDGDPFGHYECHGEQESRYEDAESWVVLITYDKTLDISERRFVLCKELMHIFDTEDGCVNNYEDYIGFLQEIEMKPIDRSEKYLSENTAKWMALLTLCPKPQRDAIKARAEAEDLSNYDVALQFRIPETIIPSLYSNFYDRAYEALIIK